MKNALHELRSVPKPPRARKPSPSVIRMNALQEQFGDHSVFTRIHRAIEDGRTELHFYRPTGSAKANQATDALLELLRLCGHTVTTRATGSSLTVLYVLGNLGGK